MYETIEAIFRALSEHGAAFLVAGGVAVNAHGYRRMTADLDLVLALDANNILRAMDALEALGYRPAIGVRARDFADPVVRADWVETRNMQVFSLVHEVASKPTVYIFASQPFDFEREYQAALKVELAPGLEVRFVRITALIRMKEAAGRPRDLDDVAHLKQILEEGATDGS